MDNGKTAQAVYATLKLIDSMSKDLDSLWQVVSASATAYTVKNALLLAAYAELVKELPPEVIAELGKLKAEDADSTHCGCPIKDESVESLLRKIIDGGSMDAHGQP